jgi:flagellar hook protein FlgE
MSILNAMYSGVSGLSAEGDALGVIGDNVANANTVGFKESRAIFENVLGSAVGTEGGIGSGVRMARTQQIFAEGSMTNTGQPTDLALSGDGFFVVNGSVSGISGNFYTRAGQTSLRNDGTLVNPAGLAFQGYKANLDGTMSSTLGPIKVNTAALSPKPTTEMTVTANLDATQTTPATPWDPQNPGTTSNFSTSMQIFDSLGNAHTADVYFRQTAGGSWDYHVLASGSEVAGGAPGTNTEIGAGTLAFNGAGALQTNTVTAGGTVSFNGAVANQALKLNFGTPIASGGTGLDGTTQFGSPSAVSAQGQDGYSSGSLSGIKIDSTGVVDGVYTNGQSIAVGQLAIAKFQSNDGLGQAGQNLWTATHDSGDAALGAAGAGGRGGLVAGALENSNVDIATQFVDLIAHQRAFQANAKTITTADQMLQDLMTIKQ